MRENKLYEMHCKRERGRDTKSTKRPKTKMTLLSTYGERETVE